MFENSEIEETMTETETIENITETETIENITETEVCLLYTSRCV